MISTIRPNISLSDQGLTGLKEVYYNCNTEELLKLATLRQEGHEGVGGSFMVTTGDHTGRSPQDKFFVKNAETSDKIDWSNNAALSVSAFTRLKADMVAHMAEGTYYVQDLYAGADPEHKLNIRVITELAWHSLFIRHLLRIPETIADFVPDYTIINCPTFKADPERHDCRSETIIAINMNERMILIGGTEYAGEIKKAVFTLLNYLLPQKDVMPMHCSANHAIGNKNDTAVFFGLSGTGKTTLSADATRTLIGDDEHGWADNGIFNFEGGCYAKTINLNPKAEPEIYAATRKYGTVIENMVFNPHTLEPDFTDDSLTANMRCAYPLTAIPNASETSRGGHPTNIIMLTCDAFGVLPPVAWLSPAQAVYHFLSGFTAKVAGTERGVTEPQPTFSTCFGAPFMPLKPEVYGNQLYQNITRHNVQCWLINTGWTGGAYGDGERMPLPFTRTILHSILDGSIHKTSYRKDANFGFDVPINLAGVDSRLLNPRNTWKDAKAYDAQAKKLVTMFAANFQRFDIAFNDDEFQDVQAMMA